jgi:ABC-type iron transport system FetAB permease component
MIRFVVIALIVLAVWLVLLNVLRLVRRKNIDWTGIATMIGFVVLAFYLHHVTGIGWW